VNSKHLKVLLIEDNPDDVAIVREAFAEVKTVHLALEAVERLGDGLERLQSEQFDVLLLDLSLPDGQGLDTLLRARSATQEIPIIVLTGMADDELGLQAVQMGSQDYLIKGKVNGDSVIRAIRYAIERQRRQIQETRELRALDRLSDSNQTPVTAQAFGLRSLRESHSEVFEDLIRQYEGLLDRALETQSYKIDAPPSDKVQDLSERLGFLRAGPRDLIEIHTIALRNKVKETNMTKMLAYAEEGRLLLLESMGYLVAYYRNMSLGTR
jgi:DNA-binding response OmpR family regulator